MHYRLAKRLFPFLSLVFLPAASVFGQTCAGNWQCPCPGMSRDSGVDCRSAPPDCNCVCGGACPQSGGGGGAAPAGGGQNSMQQMELQAAGQFGYAIGAAIRQSWERQQQEAQQQAILEQQRQAALAEQARQRELERQRLFEERKRKLIDEMGGDTGKLSMKDDDSADDAARERWIGQMCQAEMDQRKAALGSLKGSPDESWCKLNLIHVRCPSRPINDIAGQYPGMVENYISWKNRWDWRCGGPSAQKGYKGFDNELRSMESQAPVTQTAETTSPSPEAGPKAGSESSGLTMKDDESPSAANPASASTQVSSPADSGRLALKDDDAASPMAASDQEPKAAPINDSEMKQDDSATAGGETQAGGSTKFFGTGSVNPKDAGLDADSAAPRFTGNETPALPLHQAPSYYSAPSFPDSYRPSSAGIEGRGGSDAGMAWAASETPMEKLIGGMGLTLTQTLSGYQEKVRTYLKAKAVEKAEDKGKDTVKDLIVDNVSGSKDLVARYELTKGGRDWVVDFVSKKLLGNVVDVMNAGARGDDDAADKALDTMSKLDQEASAGATEKVMDQMGGPAAKVLKTTDNPPDWVARFCKNGGANGLYCRKNPSSGSE